MPKAEKLIKQYLKESSRDIRIQSRTKTGCFGYCAHQNMAITYALCPHYCPG